MTYYRLTDDSKERVSLLIKDRLPWLMLGLLGGMVATILVSRFENILSANISLAFFLPVIVYMSDAVGTQTETIYIRNLSKFKDNFFQYLFKEILVGISFGLILASLLGLFAQVWLGSTQVALTVGLAMFINATIAPLVGLIVPEILFKERLDPALGAGPLTTITQDIISLMIYFLVAAVILL